MGDHMWLFGRKKDKGRSEQEQPSRVARPGAPSGQTVRELRKRPATGYWRCDRCKHEWETRQFVPDDWVHRHEGPHVCPQCGSYGFTYPVGEPSRSRKSTTTRPPDPQPVTRPDRLAEVARAAETGDVLALTKVLRSGEKAIERKAAAKALGKIGGAGVVEPLGAALHDESKGVHEAAASALAGIGGDRAVELLADALRRELHPDPDIDGAALVTIGGPKVTEILIAALAGDYLWTRWAAAEALGKLGDPIAVMPIITLLRDKEPAVRGGAALALGELGDPVAVEPLIAVLRDEESTVRRAAAKVLRTMDDPRAVEPLARARAKDPYLY